MIQMFFTGPERRTFCSNWTLLCFTDLQIKNQRLLFSESAVWWRHNVHLSFVWTLLIEQSVIGLYWANQGWGGWRYLGIPPHKPSLTRLHPKHHHHRLSTSFRNILDKNKQHGGLWASVIGCQETPALFCWLLAEKEEADWLKRAQYRPLSPPLET